MSGVDERFDAEKRRLWDNQQLTYRYERGSKTIFDPRAQERPQGKPYANNRGVFRDIIALLPLEDGDEIDKFASKVRRFTKDNGPLSIGSARDAEDRPLIWYAVDTNDPIACEILLNQGAATSAFMKIRETKSPFEHAYSKRYDRVVEVLNGWAVGELTDIAETQESLALAATLKSEYDQNDCSDCPPCPPSKCRRIICHSKCSDFAECCSCIGNDN